MTATLFLSLALLLGSLVGAQAGCVNQTIQLEESGIRTERGVNGTVRYCLNGEWRTLCRGGEKWQAREAIVTCRQLGFEGGEQLNSSTSSRDVSFRLLRNCDSTENNIEECGGIIELNGCGEDSHGALRCLLVNCTDGDIRLVGGYTIREGRVEVCMNGRWGTVCNNSKKGIEGAVCSNLGFPDRGKSRGEVAEPAFVSAGAPIHMCNATNDQLYCEPVSDLTCNHTMDLWVTCSRYNETEEIQYIANKLCNLGNSTAANNSSVICQVSPTSCEMSNPGKNTSTIGVLGAFVSVLVALQAVTLTILCIVIFHKKCSQKSSQEYPTKTNVAQTINNIPRLVRPDHHTRVDSDQEDYDQQDPTINNTHYNKPQKLEPYAEITEMALKKPPNIVSDRKVTSAVSMINDFNDAEQHTYEAVDEKRDERKLRNKCTNPQLVGQAQISPDRTPEKAKASEMDDFYEAEQHTYSVVDMKHKKKRMISTQH